MKPSGKTPYEIRLDLLQLAFDILTQQHRVKGCETATGNPYTSPTTEEVIIEANKLNGFISKDNN
jgi:hypothetical protein